MTAATSTKRWRCSGSNRMSLLVDYHLHDRLDGLGLIDALRERAGRELPAALLTGDGSDAVKLARARTRLQRC